MPRVQRRRFSAGAGVTALTAPFPYFGGKRRVAAEVWARLGNVANYIEPFFGSGAVLLARPHEPHIETVSDADHYLCNLWRAIQAEPDAVARWADWPVNECDLAVRHAWLVTEGRARIAACDTDAAHYDAQVAGWWLWGACSWIGSGWCSNDGPWSIKDGKWVKAGCGGIRRKRPHLSGAGQGINSITMDVTERLRAITVRLRRVRVVCGDWTRVAGDSVMLSREMFGVFLDPPYSVADRADCYSQDCRKVAIHAATWAREIGHKLNARVAFAGYKGEHDFPGWTTFQWEAIGSVNAARETIWFSPACLSADQPDMFGDRTP